MDFHPHRVFKGPGFAETLYLGSSGGRTVVRKQSNPDALPFSRIALAREIRLLRNLPEKLRCFYPEILATNLPDGPEDCVLTDDESAALPAVIFYDMPYFDPAEGWAPLSRCLLEGIIGAGHAKKTLGEIIDTAFLAFRLDEREPPPDYLERTMLRAVRESLTFAETEPSLREVVACPDLTVSGAPVPELCRLRGFIEDSPRLGKLLTPARDRFLHGDFFPENILCNIRTGRWLLLDPVSVRGVHRGDFVLDTVKMGEWLSGELPALRSGLFDWSIRGNRADLSIHLDAPELAVLRGMGLAPWYAERLASPEYRDVFEAESGWETRAVFVRAFYAFSMLPLADARQAVARALVAIAAMGEFIGRSASS